MDIRVNQESGTIHISTNGDAPVAYEVRAGIVQLDPLAVGPFLRAVPGSALVQDAPPAAERTKLEAPAKE